MSIVIKELNDLPIGKHKVTIFVDPTVKKKRILIDKSYKDDNGRIVGDYPIYDFDILSKESGDLISRDDLISKSHYSTSVGVNVPIEEIINAPAVIEGESSEIASETQNIINLFNA